MYDLFVTIVLARSWNMNVGDTRDVMSNFEDDFYDIEATAVKETTIKTPAGKFDTMEVTLRQRGELKGFFKKGGTMRFWVTRGEHPQLVRVDLRAKIGTLVMSLESAKIDESLKTCKEPEVASEEK